jgi:phage FluMu protein Com
MSRSTISMLELFKLFPDEQSARVYLERRLWVEGVKCPNCKSGNRISVRKNGSGARTLITGCRESTI